MKNLTYLLFLLLPVLSCAQVDSTIIEEFIQQHIDDRHFEGTILIAEEGQIAYQLNHGFADRENQIPIKDDSKFAIASITKMLTAIIILQLVDEEKLSLDQNLQELLPQLDIPNGENITVHQL
ncbi:MAG: serine hydrolase domain-containing protein, partial [Bacteroidota bacterium]